MKQLTVKQAEKWLQKIRNANPNLYKEISKELKKYERGNDSYDCFVKMNSHLLGEPQLTHEINHFMEEGNKFVVEITQVQRIDSLMKHIKGAKPEIYQKITKKIRDMTKDQSDQRQDNQVKNLVFQSVKGYKQLEAYADSLLNFDAVDAIHKLDLQHLKHYQHLEEILQEDVRIHPKKKQKIHVEPPIPEKIKQYQPFKKKWLIPSLTNPAEEKNFIRSIEKELTSKQFQNLVKFVHLYSLNIISKTEVIDFVKHMIGEQELQSMIDIVQSREADRRRNSCFKPLIDLDFHNSIRASHSYVATPSSYPILCSGKKDKTQQILNDKWISIPRGSEQFNIRSKNVHEFNLLRAEDERYELDHYLQKLKIAEKTLNKMETKLNENSQNSIEKEITTITSLGIVQLMYKQGNKEQKEELEWFLKNNPTETVKLFHDRVKANIHELEEIRKVHGCKNWNEIAVKNWSKSLDFKGFAFKKNERDRMRPNVFLQELNVRYKYLQSKCHLNDTDTPFQDKKQFFSVFNSFESSSRIQRTMNRNMAKPTIYDVKEHKIPGLLPVMIMSLEDQPAISLSYSFIIYYLENSGVSEAEKLRCKNFLRQIMERLFKITNFRNKSLSSLFDEELFYSRIFDGEEASSEIKNIKDWIMNEEESSKLEKHVKAKIPKFKYLPEKMSSQFNFQPAKTKENEVFLSSQQFYLFIRFFYALYERIIRMKEVSENEEHALLFQILFYCSIKTKESAKFQECLSLLFKTHSHLFSTIYKLLQNLVKSLNNVSLCSITNESMKLMGIQCEQIYILLLNKYYLTNNISNSKIFRFTYEWKSKLMYINSLESYYKTDEQGRQLSKRRLEIAKDIEIYTVDEMPQFEIAKESYTKNGFEYSFEGNTIKMLNLWKGEDIVLNKKKNIVKEELNSEIEKAYCLWRKCH